MPINCARRELIDHLEARLDIIGKGHSERGALEAASHRANALGCAQACASRTHCAIGRDDPILRLLADGLQAREPEPTTIIND